MSDEEFIICVEIDKYYKLGVKSHTFTKTTQKEIKALEKNNQIFDTVKIVTDVSNDFLFMIPNHPNLFLYRNSDEEIISNENSFISYISKDAYFNYSRWERSYGKYYKTRFIYILSRKDDIIKSALPFCFVDIPTGEKGSVAVNKFSRKNFLGIGCSYYSNSYCINYGVVKNQLNFYFYNLGDYLHWNSWSSVTDSDINAQLLDKVSVKEVKEKLANEGAWFINEAKK